MKVSRFLLVLVFTASFFWSLGLSIVNGNTLVFEDNFDTPNFNKWSIVGPAGWTFSNGQFGYSGFSASNAVPSDTFWNNSWQNLVFETDLTGISGTDKNLVFHFIDANNFYSVHHTGDFIHLEKFIGTQLAGSAIEPAIFYPLVNGVTYRFKLIIDGDSIKLFEGNTLLFDAIDDSEPKISNGKVGLRVGLSEVWYDNVVVSSLDGEELISLDVPDLKQYSPPWEDDLYDQATEWSFDPTMRRWGCAVTSAAMVLGFHGFDIDPGELNSWLKSKPDGYLGNGLVNWLAISRYTKQNPISGVHALEFRRYPYSPERQLEELEEQRPSILKEPNHFVVAKSQAEDSFGINDPGYSDRPTLASYSNTAQNLYSYIPSSTDLSYILLTIDPSFNLTVKDPDGLDIEGYYWIEEPLVDDVDGSETSGDPVGIFMYPKPTYGNYLVEVQGNGSYSLGTYLYDEDGNVLMQDYNGFGGDLNDEYLISVGDESFISFPLDNILNDLDQLYLDGKFKNFGSYNSLRKQLLKVEEFLDNNQVFNAKVLLDAILLRLTHANKLGEELEITQLRGQIQNYYNTI